MFFQQYTILRQCNINEGIDCKEKVIINLDLKILINLHSRVDEKKCGYHVNVVNPGSLGLRNP